jgi:exodeoxyribonuclease V alpha subunit
MEDGTLILPGFERAVGEEQTLEGVVLRARSFGGGLRILDVEVPQGNGRTVTEKWVGDVVPVGRGLRVRGTGAYEVHHKHGRQFTLSLLLPELDRSRRGLLAYLEGGFVEGLGEGDAERLVDAFGEHLPDVLDDAPERLVDVPGVDAERAGRIARGWAGSPAAGPSTAPWSR